jgi:hypothetical protein
MRLSKKMKIYNCDNCLYSKKRDYPNQRVRPSSLMKCTWGIDKQDILDII